MLLVSPDEFKRVTWLSKNTFSGEVLEPIDGIRKMKNWMKI